MNVLFLDVDGVLNRCSRSGWGLESDKIELLRWIVQMADPLIVVSSTWRESQDALVRLRLMFEDIGARYGGHTPIKLEQSPGGIYIGYTRGDEIQKWIDDNGPVEKFVILDDISDMGHLLPHLIKTESFTGLTQLIAHDVVEAFKS